jgi:hypothetical protein
VSARHGGLPVLVVATACTSVACSQIIGIDDREGRWCVVEGTSHDFCDDFDRPEAFAAWRPASNIPPEVGASDRSEPNSFVAEDGAVLQRDFEASKEILVEMDLRIFASSDHVDPPTNDHTLALISRAGGSAGLFAGPGGVLFFGWLSGIPEPLEVSLTGRWARVGISIVGEDAKQARLAIDGEVVKVAVRPDPPPKPDENAGIAPSDLVLGSQPLGSTKSQVKCEFDNVTVDLFDRISTPPMSQ